MFHRGSELSNGCPLEWACGHQRLFLTHLEGMDPTRQPSLGEVAEHVYSREGLLGQPARQEWERFAGNEPPETAFREAYQQYVTDGATFGQRYPERYDFLQQHVFSGREFHEQSRTEQIERGIEALWDMELLC